MTTQQVILKPTTANKHIPATRETIAEFLTMIIRTMKPMERAMVTEKIQEKKPVDMQLKMLITRTKTNTDNAKTMLTKPMTEQ